MARTPEGSALTNAHRLIQVRLQAATIRDLLHLWATVDPANLRETLDPFARAGTLVVRNNRAASAAAAQRYYLAFRAIEGVQGALAIALPASVPDDVVAGQLRGAGIVGISNARRRGATLEAAHANGFTKLGGSAAQLVAGGGRDTLMGAIKSDPEAHGWQRVTDGSPCAFCAMVASQGIIFKDEGAGFEAHSHCGCTAEPAFEGSSVRPDNEQFRQAWDAATDGLSGGEALNAFRRHLESPK